MKTVYIKNLPHIEIVSYGIKSDQPFSLTETKNIVEIIFDEAGVKKYDIELSSKISSIYLERVNLLYFSEKFNLSSLTNVHLNTLSKLDLYKVTLGDINVSLDNVSVLTMKKVKCGIITLSMNNSIFIKNDLSFKKINKIRFDSSSKIIDKI